MTDAAVTVGPDPRTEPIPAVVPVGAAASAVERFTAFARSGTPGLFRVAYLLCGDEHRARDLVQLALERTYRAWDRLEGGDPYAYARRVIATARVDSWRRTRREVLAQPADLTGAQSTSDVAVGDVQAAHAEHDRVVRALLALPVKQRRVVLLRYLLDRSELETADELGIPVGTVKSTAARALTHLRDTLRPEAGAHAGRTGAPEREEGGR